MSPRTRLTRIDLLIGNTPSPPAYQNTPRALRHHPHAPATLRHHPQVTHQGDHPGRVRNVPKRTPNASPLRSILNAPCACPQPTHNVRRVQNTPDQYPQVTWSFLLPSSLAQPVGDPSSSSAYASTAVTRSSRSRSYSVADHTRKCPVNGAPYLDKEVDVTRESVFFLRKL